MKSHTLYSFYILYIDVCSFLETIARESLLFLETITRESLPYILYKVGLLRLKSHMDLKRSQVAYLVGQGFEARPHNTYMTLARFIKRWFSKE
jgi:hypothetical protein